MVGSKSKNPAPRPNAGPDRIERRSMAELIARDTASPSIQFLMSTMRQRSQNHRRPKAQKPAAPARVDGPIEKDPGAGAANAQKCVAPTPISAPVKGSPDAGTSNSSEAVMEFLNKYLTPREFAGVLRVEHRLDELHRARGFGAIPESTLRALDNLKPAAGANGSNQGRPAVLVAPPRPVTRTRPPPAPLPAARPPQSPIVSSTYRLQPLQLTPPAQKATDDTPPLFYDPERPPSLEKCTMNRRIIFSRRIGWIRGYELADPYRPQVRIEWSGELRDTNEVSQRYINLAISR